MCIGMNSFGAFTQEMGNFIDMRTCKASDVDLEIIAANAAPGVNSRLNPQNQIIRHQFLEVFIRLCYQKMVKNQYAGKDMTMTTGFQIMFDEFIQPHFKKYDAHIWRKEKLWEEWVDYSLKISLPGLKEVYKKNTGKFSMPGAPKFMTCIEFEDMIVGANCLNEKFG